MKLPKLIMPLMIALCSNSALAAVDCSTVTANAAGFVGYKQQGASDITSFRLLEKPTNLSVCGLKISSDGNSYSFQAPNIASLSKLFSGQGTSWKLMMAELSSIGGQPALTESARLSVTFPPESAKGIRLGGSFSGDLSTSSVISVRANDGKLQTLLKDMKFTSLYFDPKTTKKLELYIKSPSKLTWTRMLFDIANNKLTFYKNSTYPSK